MHTKLLKLSGLLAVGIIVCTFLTIAVYAIPVSWIRENVSESVELMEEQGTRPFAIPGYFPSYIDQFTDAVMLGIAVYGPYDSLIDNAMINRYFGSDAPIRYLRDYLNGVPVVDDVYGRYWHGYLVYVKPLLIFFSISSIRIFLGMLILLFIVLITGRLSKFGGIIPFFSLLVTLCLPAVLNCLQYASCALVGFGATMFILYHDTRTEHGSLLFMLIGMCTAFFDFLSYPVFTLVLPASVWIVKNQKSVSVGRVISLIFSWAAGYAGLWAGKWLVGTLLTKENLFADALQALLFRTSTTDEAGDKIPVLSGLLYCLKLLFTPLNTIGIAGGFIFSLVRSLKCRCFTKQTLIIRVMLLLLVAVPAGWSIVTCNHTFNHGLYTYRSVASGIFPLLLAVSPLDENGRMGEMNEKGRAELLVGQN